MEGGLVLDWKSGWAQGGERGPAIIPTKPDDSLLIQAVEHSHAELRMPEERLPPEEIEVLREWIKRGAFDDRTLMPTTTDPMDWWSLKPLQSPDIPLDRTNPIDAFIDKRLREASLVRSPVANPRERLRRLYYR